MSNRDQWIKMIEDLQDNICRSIEITDGSSLFKEDVWKREEGGGGKTRIISNGDVFEKGGVNTSVVYGELTDAMRSQLNITAGTGSAWFAAGISIVLHPVNPFVPTVHCNYRMFELYDVNGAMIDQWFGGGADLTPYYLYDEDAIHFHGVYKNVCDSFDPSFYYVFKKACDNYFVNVHRNMERRGIGGIFYDYQKPSGDKSTPFWLNFGEACGKVFLDSYLPIVEKRKNIPYNEMNLHWQEIRRGRYVEFNLVYDRGTIFGLKTKGRTESILMSLPPRARFEYNYQPERGSEEEKTLEICLNPREWI